MVFFRPARCIHALIAGLILNKHRIGGSVELLLHPIAEKPRAVIFVL